ncbi:hypothetical protein DB346_18190 [Verrucomicrobia bacterium LW23]|nr:hypothetical protein DB346_18190 [Verrucomicrobia bacterium LW23]
MSATSYPPETSAAAAWPAQLWKNGDQGTHRAWRRPDGAAATYTAWESDGGAPVERVIVAVHGISGAPRDFVPLGHAFRRRRTHIFAPQMRGQGHETDDSHRGDITSSRLWLNDIRHFLRETRQRHPGVPIYLYGESMGAILSVNTLDVLPPEELPTGAILASPVFAIDNPPNWWRTILYNTAMYLLPRRRLRFGEFKTKRDKDLRITNDDEYQAALHAAPHYVSSYTFRFFRELRKLILNCPRAAARLSVPTFVPYAVRDIFIRPATLEAFWKLADNPNVTLSRYEESHHLLLHDVAMERVLEDLTRWLASVEKR